MKAGATEALGTSGQSYMKARFEEFGWAAVANPEHDLGTDLWLSPRNEQRVDLGIMLGAQVKNGEKFFNENGVKDGGNGWWHRNDRKHFEYWISHAVPHILILRNPTTQQAYWVHIDRDTVKWTGKGGKLFVPEGQVLNADSLSALIDIAKIIRPTRSWVGSAWNGARDLAPDAVLRHALLAPRLLAPHPNAGAQVLQNFEAIALLAAGRFGELHQYGLLNQDTPQAGWAWDFFSALWKFVESLSIDSLRTCVINATEPYEQAAAVAVLSAALAEESSYEEALEFLQESLTNEGHSQIDRDWLKVHRARCLTELGEREEAIDIAASIQDLPKRFPDDVTAAAIAGSGASLVFRASSLFEGDIATTVTAGDTETSWWRAQAMSWGLSSVFDESFREWDRSETRILFNNDRPTYRLRGISLVDGFTARHDNWCYTMSLIAKSELMSGKLDAEDASTYLTDLRRAGDTKGVKVAVKHLLEAGPAVSVRQSADLIDLDRATRTEADASFELLIRGADVLSTATADATALWAMRSSSELSMWADKIRPDYNIEHRRSELLGALLVSVSSEVESSIREYLVNLPLFPNAASAHMWARTISAVSINDWSASQISKLLQRSGDHEELKKAIKYIGVQRDHDWRRANDDALRSGSIEALEWVGPINNVPPNAAALLSAKLADRLRARLEEARGGRRHGASTVDPGRVLVLLNTHFPDCTDWEPLLELLREPSASADLLTPTIRMIESRSENIDVDTRSSLAEVLAIIVERESPPTSLLEEDPRPVALSALKALMPAAASSARWLSFQDRRGREKMILNVGRRSDLNDENILISLATDPDPHIRSSVAAALSYWVVKGIATDTVVSTLKHLLGDEGTFLARSVVKNWPSEPNQYVLPFAQILVSHISSKVRMASKRAINISE